MNGGYGISRETYIDLLNRRIAGFGKQEEPEDFQIMDMRESYDLDGFDTCDEIIAIDGKIIQLAPELSKRGCSETEVHWVWSLDRISKGTYPVEKLPRHVQDQARELYYN